MLGTQSTDMSTDDMSESSGKDLPAQLAEEFTAVLVIGLGNRLNRGASNYYFTRWGIGISEWRLLLALQPDEEVIIGQAAIDADLDKAAASRSLKIMKDKNLVDVEQTNRRGRAAIVRLTPAGVDLRTKLRKVAHERQERLLEKLSARQRLQLNEMLRVLVGQVDYMNEE